MFRRLSLALAITAALAPCGAYALGLGDIHTQSALNERLKAEIGLLSVEPDELDGVKVELASPEEFAKAGVERPFFLSGLRFTPVVLPNGRTVIQVTSKDSIREPFLDFVVEVNWAKGRLVREYTILLDPPVTLARRPPPVAAPAVVRSTAPAPEARAAGGAVGPGGLEYGPTHRNDTLWSIAQGLGVEGASVEQVMMALFQYNRGAFMRDNVNNLKIGEVLRIPQTDAIFERSREQARAEFVEQMDQWRGGRTGAQVAKKKPVAQAPSSPEVQPAAPSEPAEAEAAAPEEAPPSEAPAPEAQLKLVSGDEADVDAEASPGAEAPDSSQLQEDLLLAREETAVARQESAELRTRIAELEGRLGDMQDLLTVQNDQLAQLEAGVQETRQSQEEAARAAEAAAAAQKTPVADRQQSLLDRLQAGDTTVIGILVAIGVVLVTAIGVLVFRRRKEETGEFEESILTTPSELQSEGLGDTTSRVAGSTSQATVALSETVMAGSTMAQDTAQVDPLSEADVYMAYGRHEQAADLLKQELVRHPGRLDLQHKLLEIYYAIRKEDAFVHLAGEMAAAGAARVDADAWESVVAMGKELAPDNALFGGGSAAPAPVAPEPPPAAAGEAKPEGDSGLDFDLDLEALSGESEQERTEQAQPPEKPDTSLDFDIGELTPFEAAAEKPAETEAPKEEATDLDLDIFGEQPEEKKVDEESFDLADVDGLAPPPKPRPKEPEPEPEELTLEGLTTDDGEGGAEVETKLDLAQAYLDMGDPDDAKNILEEVLTEGNEAQKERARSMMKMLP